MYFNREINFFYYESYHTDCSSYEQPRFLLLRHDPSKLFIINDSTGNSVISLNSHGLFDFEQLKSNSEGNNYIVLSTLDTKLRIRRERSMIIGVSILNLFWDFTIAVSFNPSNSSFPFEWLNLNLSLRATIIYHIGDINFRMIGGQKLPPEGSWWKIIMSERCTILL